MLSMWQRYTKLQNLAYVASGLCECYRPGAQAEDEDGPAQRHCSGSEALACAAAARLAEFFARVLAAFGSVRRQREHSMEYAAQECGRN